MRQGTEVPDRAREGQFSPRTVDSLLQRASNWTPREAVVFLLHFDRSFRAVAQRTPTRVERLILTSLLRRRATSDQ